MTETTSPIAAPVRSNCPWAFAMRQVVKAKRGEFRGTIVGRAEWLGADEPQYLVVSQHAAALTIEDAMSMAESELEAL